METISINALGTLKEINFGGEAIISKIFASNQVAKIFTNPDFERLRVISELDQRYVALSTFCSVPKKIAVTARNEPIGIVMDYFDEFEPANCLMNADYCVKKKINLHRVAKMFLRLHDYVCEIHRQGFMIGDFSDTNLLFRIDPITNRFFWLFVDVDSWAVKDGKYNLPCSTVIPQISHPDLAKDKSRLCQEHDWYSYAFLLSRSLIKSSPFSIGTLKSGFKSNGAKFSCWDEAIQLDRYQAMHVKRFGQKIQSVLTEWLKGNGKGVFPKVELETFLKGFVFCEGERKGEGCHLEAHISHGSCPRCNKPLPKPRVRQVQQPPVAVVTPNIARNKLVQNSGSIKPLEKSSRSQLIQTLEKVG